MPSIFSDHFATTGIAASLAAEIDYDSQKRISAGKGGARLRRKTMRCVTGTAAGIGDQIRMGQFKSSDRIFNMVTTTLGGSAGAGDFGLYKSGNAHDGAVLDVDLFASAFTLSGTVARVDTVFTEATTLVNTDRGKSLWELVTIGAAFTYTSDPMEDWDLVITVTTAITVSLMTIQVEVDYTAGD